MPDMPVGHLSKVVGAWNLGSPRPFVEFALRKISEHWGDKNIFVVEAPTGYGKSVISAAIALYSAEEELKAVIYYPLRTLIEDQYDSFDGRKRGKGPICDAGLIGKRYMHNPDSRYLVKPITLTTVDTLALTLFGVAPEDFERAMKAYDGMPFSFGHYMFSWASAVLSNIVLDEVHLLADSTKSLNFLIALMKLAIKFDLRLVMMSATLPRALKETLIDALSGDANRILLITFSRRGEDLGVATYSYFDGNFVREREEKSYSVELLPLREDEKFVRLLEVVKSSEFRRVIAVFNTVGDAVNFYRLAAGDGEIGETFKKILLLHSRFTERDRERRHEELKTLGDRYLLIATQVIEAGVDVSSDLLVTEIAPASSLVQRLGRFLRYGEKFGKVVIWYEVDGNGRLKLGVSLNRKPKNWVCIDAGSDVIYEMCREIVRREHGDVSVKRLSEWRGKRDKLAIATPTYKVYDYELTLRTLEWLKENRLNVHVPDGPGGYGEFLNAVYSRDDFRFDPRAVEDLLRIHDHLESPAKAVEVLLNSEGSFVREGYQVNVVPESSIGEFIGRSEKELGRLVSELCVPVPIRALESFDVTGFLYVGEDGLINCTEIERVPTPNEILRGIRVEGRRTSPVAFVVEADYDPELGLVRR